MSVGAAHTPLGHVTTAITYNAAMLLQSRCSRIPIDAKRSRALAEGRYLRYGGESRAVSAAPETRGILETKKGLTNRRQSRVRQHMRTTGVTMRATRGRSRTTGMKVSEGRIRTERPGVEVVGVICMGPENRKRVNRRRYGMALEEDVRRGDMHQAK